MSFHLVYTIVIIVAVMAVLLGSVAYLVLAERKVSAYMQDRLGPNRVGPFGLFQPIADGLKLFFKEDITPTHVDKVFYMLAPCIAVGTALLAFAIVPFGPTHPPPSPISIPQDRELAEKFASAEKDRDESFVAAKKTFADRQAAFGKKAPGAQTDAILENELQNITKIYQRQLDEAREWYKPYLAAAQEEYKKKLEAYESETSFVIAPAVDIGLLFNFAIGSLAVYGIILGGWSANSKYSLLGSLRSSAQIISYEIPLGMSILGVILFTGSLNLERIIDWQAKEGWFILYQPLAFLLFITSVYAECNRLPFDLPEAEQELVGGYHTEYSSMKFGMFFMGEYTHMVTTSFLMSIVFFGGWHFPWLSDIGGVIGIIIKFAILGAKTTFFLMLYLFVRWTIPRFRFDQLMGLAWQLLIPISIIHLVFAMIVREYEISKWVLTVCSLGLFFAAALFGTRQKPTLKRTLVEGAV
jgi:NADH:ubiquinone oxidoreductase subunit H